MSIRTKTSISASTKSSGGMTGVIIGAAKAQPPCRHKKAQRKRYWGGDRVAALTLRTRTCRAHTNIPLKRPVVHGTLKLGSWEVTLRNPRTLGALARLSLADSIAYVPSYVGWNVEVEKVFDEELRAMLEPEDASFVARVRDSFVTEPSSGRRAKRSSK